ncbi:MAG TPA: hypothetical protein VJZ06_04910 [Mobilitalea sp.]|nr:hypothetical protein [Mobilitalea sp.]
MVDIQGVWRGMISRCKYASYNNSLAAYVGCSVCEEWQEYKNFEKWCLNNLYNCNGEKLELDKDLMVKGNRVYSPETCCFLPKRINLLIKSRRAFKNGMPPGVSWPGTRADSFVVHISLGGQKINKTFNDKYVAFDYYKEKKENYVKSVAQNYKQFLPENIFVALMTFEVLISDSECYTCENEFIKNGKPVYSSFLEYIKAKVTPVTP